MFTVRNEDRTAFMQTLEAQNARYSEEWKCPTGYLEKANYHTNLACQNVHSTREAFSYAVALLATGEDKDLKRAEEVLWHVAALQDKDPSNATYGIWSWYMEEPLDKMSPPDWNWADFCGKEICQVLEFHADRINHNLYEYLKDTLHNCALSIYRRNMHSGYTNISIMGSYVTLHASQLLAWPWLFTYARNRFKKFVEYTRYNCNTFAEYNSATYTTVAIEDLTRIYDNINDKEVHEMASEMLDIAWRTVSEHFHAPTKQWCGPNARSYSWLATKNALSFIEQGLQHSVKLTDNYIGPDYMHINANEVKSSTNFVYDTAWAYINLHCPEKYRAAFTEAVPHDVNLAFTAGPYIHAPKDLVANFHMEKDYTLSSWHVTSTWNQRRNLLGYWGNNRPRFINATILHNLYDFSSGMFVTTQKDGHALTIASLMNDGGDTHCNLDMIQNETINAYDLRVRIEVGGCVEGNWQIIDDTATLVDGGRTITVKLLDSGYDGRKLCLTSTDNTEEEKILSSKADLHRRFVGKETRKYLDVVLYSGEEKDIKLSALSECFCAMYVSIDGVPCESVSIIKKDGTINASITADGHILTAISPEKCVSRNLWKGICCLDNKTYSEIYGLPQ